jgi:hypothetical protein
VAPIWTGFPINEARLLGRGQAFDVDQDHRHPFFALLLRREFAAILAKVRLTLNLEIDKCPIGQAFIHFRPGRRWTLKRQPSAEFMSSDWLGCMLAQFLTNCEVNLDKKLP